MKTGSEATDDMGPRCTDNHFIEHVGQAYFWQRKSCIGEPACIPGKNGAGKDSEA